MKSENVRLPRWSWARDTGPTPGPGRSHVLRSNQEPQLLKPPRLRPRAPRQETPVRRKHRHQSKAHGQPCGPGAAHNKLIQHLNRESQSIPTPRGPAPPQHCPSVCPPAVLTARRGLLPGSVRPPSPSHHRPAVSRQEGPGLSSHPSSRCGTAPKALPTSWCPRGGTHRQTAPPGRHGARPQKMLPDCLQGDRASHPPAGQERSTHTVTSHWPLRPVATGTLLAQSACWL